MAIATEIKFGNNLSVIDEGSGVIRVNATAGTGTADGRISVKSAPYGAVGNGIADDTTAIQAALNAAIVGGKSTAAIYFPAGVYKITSALVVPQAFGQTFEGDGQYQTIIRQYTAGQPIFSFTEGANITHTFTCRDMGLEYDGNQTNTGSVCFFYVNGTGFFNHTYSNLRIQYAYGGWGYHPTTGTIAIWGSEWRNISVYDVLGSVWNLISPNLVGQPMLGWYDIRVLNYNRQSVAPMFNLSAITEAAMVNMDLEGWYREIMIVDNCEISIWGMHLENNRFDVAFAKMFVISTGTLAVYGWNCSGNIATINNSDQASVFHLNSGGHLILGGGVHNNDLTLGTQYITDLIYATTANGSHINLIGKIRKVAGSHLNPSESGATIQESFVGMTRPLTYGPTIATDLSVPSRTFKIVVTNTTAFTISNPTNPPMIGEEISYDIKNSSGGAHGTITWGATFLNGGSGTVGTGAFATIANGKRRIITFYWDGTNYIEKRRTLDQ